MDKDDFDHKPVRAKKHVEQVSCQDGVQATRCEYANMLGRCSFPGTMSEGIHGEGKWYCRFHYQQLYQGVSEEEAALAIAAKRKVGKVENWREGVLSAKIEEMKDDPLMQMAQRLAKGGYSREDKADFLGLLRNRVKGIGQKLPYEKASRDEGVRGENAYEDIYE